MNAKTRNSSAVIALLLIGLSLIPMFNLTAPQAARAAGVLYAAPTVQGSGNCSSWANACTLQTALAQAQSDDEIWVKAGVHYPGTLVTDTFVLRNGVAVYGGFVGTETQRDERDWQTNKTILSGDIDHNDITDPNGVVTTTAHITGTNTYHVVTGSGTNDTATLDGFVITAGWANGATDNEQSGGGMININGSPTVVNTTFVGNAAVKNGGGMRNYNAANPRITNVTFRDNTAQFGGAISNHYSNPELKNVVFVGNSATENGGGLDNYFSSPMVVNAVFSGNTAQNNGGGVYNTDSGSQPHFINVTFSGNSATSGGGMCNVWNSHATLVNVILWGNLATSGPQIDNANSGTATVSYSNVQGGWAGTGNVNANPLFVDADGADSIVGTVDDNLRLGPNSPCIDAGDNNLSVTVTTDLDGNSRFVDIPTVPDTGNGAPPIVDIGAYEAQYADLALDKADLPPTVAPGQPITFALTLTNTGSIPAAGVLVTDTLPTWLGGASFTSTLVITDTGHTSPYVWQVQDLAPGQGGVITVTGVLTVPLAAATYTNTALLSAAGDLLAENNTAVITFTVPNVAPVFTSAPVITATQDAPYTYTATARDDNGDSLAITAPTLPTWLTLVDHGDGTATLSGTPSNADVGEHPVLLRVTDSGGLSDTQAFTITVANVNDAPFFTSAPVLTATQDAPYAYAVAADDPDLIHGDALTITAPTLPAWLTLVDHGDGTATLAGTPGDDDVGQHLVVLRVTDREGRFAKQEFVITVSEKPRCYIYIPLVFRNWRP